MGKTDEDGGSNLWVVFCCVVLFIAAPPKGFVMHSFAGLDCRRGSEVVFVGWVEEHESFIFPRREIKAGR